jgi:hypothetical protein
LKTRCARGPGVAGTLREANKAPSQRDLLGEYREVADLGRRGDMPARYSATPNPGEHQVWGGEAKGGVERTIPRLPDLETHCRNTQGLSLVEKQVPLSLRVPFAQMRWERQSQRPSLDARPTSSFKACIHSLNTAILKTRSHYATKSDKSRSSAHANSVSRVLGRPRVHRTPNMNSGIKPDGIGRAHGHFLRAWPGSRDMEL